jgi:hypothetical protein
VTQVRPSKTDFTSGGSPQPIDFSIRSMEEASGEPEGNGVSRI